MHFSKLLSVLSLAGVATVSAQRFAGYGLQVRDVADFEIRDASLYEDALEARDFDENSLYAREALDFLADVAPGLYAREPVRRPNAPSFPKGTIDGVNKDYERKKARWTTQTSGFASGRSISLRMCGS